MDTNTLDPSQQTIYAPMGSIQVGHQDQSLIAVLGSCVAVAICDPSSHVAGLAHTVFPNSSARTGPPERFADTAIPLLIDALTAEGAARDSMVAKIVGGANMYGNQTPEHVGTENIEATLAVVQHAGIRVAGQHTGGTQGRFVQLVCASGQLRVEIAGATRITI